MISSFQDARFLMEVSHFLCVEGLHALRTSGKGLLGACLPLDDDLETHVAVDMLAGPDHAGHLSWEEDIKELPTPTS